MHIDRGHWFHRLICLDTEHRFHEQKWVMGKTACLLWCYLICGEDSGPKLSVSVVSGRWMWAWSTHQESHNISSFTGCTDWLPICLMGKMLRGWTVFSLRQILIHRQPAFITSFAVTLLLTLGEEKKLEYSLILNNNMTPTLSHRHYCLNLETIGRCNIVLIFTNHMLLIRHL